MREWSHRRDIYKRLSMFHVYNKGLLVDRLHPQLCRTPSPYPAGLRVNPPVFPALARHKRAHLLLALVRSSVDHSFGICICQALVLALLAILHSEPYQYLSPTSPIWMLGIAHLPFSKS